MNIKMTKKTAQILAEIIKSKKKREKFEKFLKRV
jgi:hypothetical protein